jgi:16S rRNA (adenine1518-N6/adenine1519-N6)-dimethyltransferase
MIDAPGGACEDDSVSPERASLLGAAEIRRIAEELGLRPTKTLGQNFVHDANVVRRIVTLAGVGTRDDVLEVGPGLGSLTLALLAEAGSVTAVEIDPRLAERLPATVAEHAPDRAAALTVIAADALGLRAADLPVAHREPGALVANLPYNVAVPVLLHLLSELPSLRRVLVMVQAEVADRLAAPPGSRTYGAPSAKAAWYGTARRVGSVSRSVFWPVPGVDSALVAIDRRPEPRPGDRRSVFAVVDAAFAQRRKTLRSALSSWAGSAPEAEQVLRSAGVDPGARGEQLDVETFCRIAAAGAAHRRSEVRS